MNRALMPFLPVIVIFALIAGILFTVEAAYQLGLRRWAQVPEHARTISTTLEASVFALMGLLVAFTFSGAGTRFEIRRNLIAEEANAIGTSYLRLDLLPPDTQDELRNYFRQYVHTRLAVYEKIPDIDAVQAALDHSWLLQHKIWTKSVEASQRITPAEKSLLLGSLNQMIDITQIRTVALLAHPPLPVFVMLGLTIVASSSLAGYSMSASGTRDWTFTIAFACVLGAALYMILDYEYPRVGFIRVDPVDQVLVETLEKMR
jgi:hypothetical protein